MLKTSRFWPLAFDEESEIYDNPSWNLPGRSKKWPRGKRNSRADGARVR